MEVTGHIRCTSRRCAVSDAATRRRYDARMKPAALILALAIVVAACGDDDGAEATTIAAEPAATTSTDPPETTSTPTPTLATTTAAPTPTTTTSTTTTLSPTEGALALTRIVFEPSSYVVITNVGGEPTELGQHWLCVFPMYQQLPAQTLAPGESVAVGLDATTPPDLVDFVAVFELGPVVGTPQASDGELGLYNASDFASATAIVDYVEWGSPGHERSVVAIEAGIWSNGAFIDIPEEAFAISSSGTVGGNEADWFVDLGG